MAKKTAAVRKEGEEINGTPLSEDEVNQLKEVQLASALQESMQQQGMLMLEKVKTWFLEKAVPAATKLYERVREERAFDDFMRLEYTAARAQLGPDANLPSLVVGASKVAKSAIDERRKRFLELNAPPAATPAPAPTSAAEEAAAKPA